MAENKPYKPRKRVLTLNPRTDESPIADLLPEDENEWLRVVDNFKVVMRNQYGFWEIQPMKGRTPAVLQGHQLKTASFKGSLRRRLPYSFLRMRLLKPSIACLMSLVE
jgi:hypothetical protein